MPVKMTSSTLRGLYLVGELLEESASQVMLKTQTRVCNKVAASEIRSQFAFATKAKEIIGPEKVLRVLETDFVETSFKCKPYSMEDERFLRIHENGVKNQTVCVFPTTASLP